MSFRIDIAMGTFDCFIFFFLIQINPVYAACSGVSLSFVRCSVLIFYVFFFKRDLHTQLEFETICWRLSSQW